MGIERFVHMRVHCNIEKLACLKCSQEVVPPKEQNSIDYLTTLEFVHVVNKAKNKLRNKIKTFGNKLKEG